MPVIHVSSLSFLQPSYLSIYLLGYLTRRFFSSIVFIIIYDGLMLSPVLTFHFGKVELCLTWNFFFFFSQHTTSFRARIGKVFL